MIGNNLCGNMEGGGHMTSLDKETICLTKTFILAELNHPAKQLNETSRYANPRNYTLILHIYN